MTTTLAHNDLKALEKEWRNLASKARWEQKKLGRVSEETREKLRETASAIFRAEIVRDS